MNYIKSGNTFIGIDDITKRKIDILLSDPNIEELEVFSNGVIKVKKNYSILLAEKFNDMMKRGNNNELVHK